MALHIPLVIWQMSTPSPPYQFAMMTRSSLLLLAEPRDHLYSLSLGLPQPTVCYNIICRDWDHPDMSQYITLVHFTDEMQTGEWELNPIKIQGLMWLGEVSDVLVVWSMLQ